MALIFTNGGAPNYLGFQFTSAANLIDQIELTLNSAGWATIAKTPGASLFVRGNSIVNGSPAFVEFVIESATPPLQRLRVVGWIQQAKTNGTPNVSQLKIDFNDGGANRLWLTADQQSGCITIFSSSGAMNGIHFGFVDRVDTADATAWAVGQIRASGSPGLIPTYFSFTIGVATPWQPINNSTSTSSLIAQLQTYDLITRLASSTVSAPNNGAPNSNNRYVVTLDYGYVETSTAGLSSDRAFRGFVPYCACGLASLQSAEQIVDPLSSQRFLSTGPLSHQGIRIL
ncbi:MAG: hypothetical protein HC840_05025 [Leptolyngbyaceae cyanobacterium RM2_2_4]|nr:hypothetical protein [Leptolyngbyaceae cyanobacterium RM2_2_4]